MATSSRYPTVTRMIARYKKNAAGDWVYDNAYNFAASIVKWSDKDSVDDGVFVPGTYRVNPYSAYREEYGLGGKAYTIVFYGIYRYVLLDYLLATDIARVRDSTRPTMITQLSAEALLKAYAQLGKGDLSLGEDLGEIRETIEMIKRPLLNIKNFLNNSNRKNRKRLLSFLRELKRLKAGELSKRSAKLLASRWLEFRYGWSPLVSTLSDVLEELVKKDHALFDPNKIRSKRSRVTSTSVSIRDETSYQGWGYMVRCPLKTEDCLTGYASVQYRQSRPYTFATNLGISPRFIPELAWELTKLSFVWDWFFTIGPWIESFRVKPEIEVLGSTVGEKFERKITLSPGTFFGTQVNGDPATWNYESYVRRIPDYRPLFPVFRAGDVIGLAKSIDSVALILQRILK